MTFYNVLELAKNALSAVEWCIGVDGRCIERKSEQWSCPLCNWGEKDGHSSDCMIGQALEAIEQYVKEEKS